MRACESGPGQNCKVPLEVAMSHGASVQNLPNYVLEATLALKVSVFSLNFQEILFINISRQSLSILTERMPQTIWSSV